LILFRDEQNLENNDPPVDVKVIKMIAEKVVSAADCPSSIVFLILKVRYSDQSIDARY
jgi:hypothetical protein